MKTNKLYIGSRLLSLGFLLSVVASSSAASDTYKELRGHIYDEATRQPVAGVQIQTLGDNRYAAMTDETGAFTIKVPAKAAALYIHTAQYSSQQVAIGNGGEISVYLLPDKFRTMYDNGTSITAAVKTDIHSTTSQTIEPEIGQTLGADVRTVSRNGGPGYGAAMFVRGLNSLNANAQPLVVVDGVVQDMQYARTALHDGDYTNLMLNINPDDVESVQVLKNATALYGAKGGNGVVIITTKRGCSMATRIDANIGVGVTMQPRLPEMMDAAQYRIYASDMLATYPSIGNKAADLKFLNDDASKYYYPTYHNDTDWSREVYRTALTQNYSINVQGGDNIGMYNLSLGYTDGQSTAKENGFTRLNVRFNTDLNITKGLTTRFDMAFAKTTRNVFDNGCPADFSSAPVSSPTLLALIKAPILNPYRYNNVTGQLSGILAGADDFLTDVDPSLTLANPSAILSKGEGINKNRAEMTDFQLTVMPKYELSPSLSIQNMFHYSFDNISQRYYRPLNGVPEFTIDGIGTVQNMAKSMSSKEANIENDLRLNYRHLWDASALRLDAMVGMRYISNSYDDNEPEGQYKSAGDDNKPNISDDMDFKETSGANESVKDLAWYAQADLSWLNRYYLQAGLTMESNSRFGDEAGGLGLAGVRWALFPNVQLGWAMSSEPWMKAKAINYLLIRAGFDLSGNDDISNRAARSSFSVSKYLDASTAASLTNIGNAKIQWEQTAKFNVGFKAWLLNNRLGVDFDIYHHRTTNLLTLKDFDTPTAGVKSYWSNGGTMDNDGLELSVTGKPIVAKHLSLELGASVGHYKNEVKSLPTTSLLYSEGKQIAVGYTSSIYGTSNIATIVGQPAGVFYGYKTQGVLSTDTEAAAAGKGGYLYQTDETGARQYFKAGDMCFADLNGDGAISEADKTIIGDPNPDFYGNVFASLTYKNWTLSVVFNYSVGNDIFNYQRSILEGGSNFYNQTKAMESRWTNEGQQTDVPRVSYGDPMGNSRFSDRWIEDGSYLRLRTLNLGYKIPVKSSWLQGLSVWAEANNLFTLTKYLGGDPEMSAANGVLYQGIDAGNVALSRAFTMGVKINL